MGDIAWKIISFVMPISVFLCLLLVVTQKKYRYFIPYIIFTLFILLIEKKAIALANKGIYNIWLYNYETVIEFGLHIWLVSRFLINKKIKQFLYLFIFFYLSIGFYRCITTPNDYTFDNFIYYTGCFVLLVSSTYYFFELLLYPTDFSLIKMPSFWFCTGVLLFNSFTFAYFGISELLTQISKKVLFRLNEIKTLAYLLAYILFCIAFICQIKIKKLLPSS
jgi:hypothetical protein